MSYCHSWPLVDTMGGRSASWSANMSFNSINLYKWRYISANMSSNSTHVKLSLLTTRRQYWGGRSATWFGQVLVQLLVTRYQYRGGGDLQNLNTLHVSCFTSQRSFRLYERLTSTGRLRLNPFPGVSRRNLLFAFFSYFKPLKNGLNKLTYLNQRSC